MLRGYSYKAACIERPEFKIKYSVNTKQLHIGPLYLPDVDVKEGTCTELMNTSYHELRKQFPQHKVYRALGTDSVFFPDGPHAFNLLSETDVLRDVQFVCARDISKIPLHQMLMIDPSFGNIGDYRRHGYRIANLCNHDFPIICPNNFLLDEGVSTPIARTKNGVAFLRHSSSSPNIISIFQIGFDGIRERYGLRSNDLDRLIENERSLAKIINKLRSTPIEIVDRTFEEPTNAIESKEVIMNGVIPTSSENDFPKYVFFK
jgi:hypothetical protein